MNVSSQLSATCYRRQSNKESFIRTLQRGLSKSFARKLLSSILQMGKPLSTPGENSFFSLFSEEKERERESAIFPSEQERKILL